MNLKKIHAYVLVIQKRSFSIAAEILGLSQPAVSNQIKSLEKDLGIRLLNRAAVSIEPTPAGSYVYEVGKKLLVKWNELEEGVKDFHSTLSGRLRVGTSTIPGTYLLPRWIGGFNQLFPKINVINEISDSSEVLSRLLDKKIDIAITGSRSDSPQVASELVTTDSLVLISPKDYPLVSETFNGHPCDLIHYPFVIREEGSGTRRAMEEGLTDGGVMIEELRVVAQFGSTEAVLSAVEEGLGISYVSSWAADSAVQAGRVQRVSTIDSLHQSYYLSFLKGHEKAPLIKVIVDYIREKKIEARERKL